MNNKIEIKYKNIEEIIPYENNPRFNDEGIEYVAKSIKEFGFKVPIVIDKNNVIVAGHTRLKAAKKLNISSIPCIVADNLTDEQIKAFRLVDNRTSEISKWDFEKLDEELKSIEMDMSIFKFKQTLEDDIQDLNDFFEEKQPEHHDKKHIICPYCGKEIET